MRIRGWFWITLFAVLVAIAIGTIVFRHEVVSKASPTGGTTTAAAQASIELLPSDITQVQVRDLRQVLPLSGALRAINQAVVKARVSGEVRKVLVQEGEAVKAGQVVLTMDATEYLARTAQAKGAVVAARSQVEIAKQTRNNNQALVAKGFISQNASDNASSQYQIAQANLDSANAALDVTRKAVSDTTIRAPLSGVVTNRTVQPGEKVSADFHLLDVVDLRRMELEAAVPTSDIQQVALDQEVRLNIEGLPSAILGKVTRINPAIQAGSRSIIVYIEIDNPRGELRSGMFGEAQLTVAHRDSVLTIPSSAVRDVGGKFMVYAIDQGVLRQVPVTLGMTGVDSEGEAVEVTAGLTNGMQIVRGNLGNLVTGVTVKFVKPVATSNIVTTTPAPTPTPTPVLSRGRATEPIHTQ
jgi:membrane fusion protein (multidrug efflux system)